VKQKLYLQVSRSLVLVSEDTSGLNNIVSTSLTPRDLLRVPVESQQSISSQLTHKLNPWTKQAGEERGVPDAKDGDRLLTEEKGLGVLEGDVTVLPVAVHGVILEHVGLRKMGGAHKP